MAVPGLHGVGGGVAFNRLAIGVDAPLSWDWVAYSFAICARGKEQQWEATLQLLRVLWLFRVGL